MKKLLSLLVLIIFTTSSFAQQATVISPKDRVFLLKKAERQKRTGSTLMWVGGALMLGSMVIGIAHGPSGKDEPKGLEIPFALGGGSLVGGTVLLGLGKRKERKILQTTTSFNLQPIPTLTQAGSSFNYFPAIIFKVKAL